MRKPFYSGLIWATESLSCAFTVTLFCFCLQFTRREWEEEQYRLESRDKGALHLPDAGSCAKVHWLGPRPMGAQGRAHHVHMHLTSAHPWHVLTSHAQARFLEGAFPTTGSFIGVWLFVPSGSSALGSGLTWGWSGGEVVVAATLPPLSCTRLHTRGSSQLPHT